MVKDSQKKKTPDRAVSSPIPTSVNRFRPCLWICDEDPVNVVHWIAVIGKLTGIRAIEVLLHVGESVPILVPGSVGWIVRYLDSLDGKWHERASVRTLPLHSLAARELEEWKSGGWARLELELLQPVELAVQQQRRGTTGYR